jgi:hypothetical protein
MKLSIYKEEEKKEPEKELRLRLVEKYGNISLVAVDENGEFLPRGHIFTIHPDGRAVTPKGVNPELGLQLRTDGSISIFCRD